VAPAHRFTGRALPLGHPGAGLGETVTDSDGTSARLYEDAARNDLPEFLAWALVYQAESGDHAKVPLARSAADGIANPDLRARVQALAGGEPDGYPDGQWSCGGLTTKTESDDEVYALDRDDVVLDYVRCFRSAAPCGQLRPPSGYA